jgi:predicted nuclease with TOPRIM domain
VNPQILDYFDQAPNPLASRPFPYNESTIKNLLLRLREFRFSKSEIIMMINLRPANLGNLNTIVEELEGRFDDEQQEAIVRAIREVLGKADEEAERLAMTNNANQARKESMDQESRQEPMDVDG